MADNNEYKKTLEDEIGWKKIDQLHAATLNFSKKSLELKKLFFALVGIAVPTLIQLANGTLDDSLFVTIYLLALMFWILDSFTYFYQKKLRADMDEHFLKIRTRNEVSDDPFENGGKKNWNEKNWLAKSWHSLINSFLLYGLSVGLNTLALVLYLKEIIK